MSQEQTKLLSFSQVLNGLKAGKKYARVGWNGKCMYVKLHSGVIASDVVPDCHELDRLYLERFFVIVSGQRVNTWVPSVSDLLNEDWVEVI